MRLVDGVRVIVIAGQVHRVAAGVDEALDAGRMPARRLEEVERAAQVHVDEPVVGDVVGGQRGAEVADRVHPGDRGDQVIRCPEVALEDVRARVGQPRQARVAGQPERPHRMSLGEQAAGQV